MTYQLNTLYGIAAGLGGLTGIVLFAVALGQGLWRAPALLSPQEYQTELIKASPVGVGAFPPDLAWPFYTFRQAGIDRRLVRANLSGYYGRVWRRTRVRPPRFPSFVNLITLGWFLFITALYWTAIRIPVLIFFSLAGLTGWSCYGVYWAVVTGCMTVNGTAFGLTLSVMRGVEARRRARRHAHASCMHCFHVTPWPAYRCPRCGTLHQDIRPSRLGLFFRRCECGTRVPTMASRAAWRMTAICKRMDCGYPLPEGAGAVRDIRVPVFGDTSAGKTRFLYAALNALLRSAKPAGLKVSYPDQASQDQASLGVKLIQAGLDTPKTSATIPVAVTCRLGEGRASSLVHLFDAAGEHYRDAQRYDTLKFLDDGQGLVYVLDPFSIGGVRDQLAGHNAAAIRNAHTAAGDPEIAYGEVVSRLRDSGVPAQRQKLAVVISKADLLRNAGISLPAAGSEAIASWLEDLGLHNIVMSARRDFAEVRYFTVASQDTAATSADHPFAPLRWLLTAHGVRLPAGLAGAR
jgi:hypothetical protein